MKYNFFTTARIKARRMTPGDLDDLATMAQNHAVMATLGGVQERNQVITSMEHNMKHHDEHGFGYWVFEDKDTGAFMGRGGLKKVHIDGADEVELAYAFMPEYWGQGLATEIAQEIVRIGFEELGLNSIVCFSLPDNSASRRVMEKVGFTYEKECEHQGLPHVLYRFTKEQWEA